MEPKGKAKKPSKPERPAFLPRKRFAGSMHGYVFKRDVLGVGYYKDAPQVVTYKHSVNSARSKREARRREAEEQRERALMLMNSKARRLHSKVQRSVDSKARKALKLKRRSAEIRRSNGLIFCGNLRDICFHLHSN